MRERKLINQRRDIAGFTTLEVTVLCAATGIFLAFASFVLANVLQDESEEKLRNEVRSINAAITVYRLFGGSLEGLVTPESVLDSLKNNSSGSGAREATPEGGGKVIDDRLRVEMQTEDEAATSAPRAVWNRITERFEIVHGAVRGVKRFIFGENLASLAFAPDNRMKTSTFSQDESWMWDSEVAAPGRAKEYGVAKSPDDSDRTESRAVAAVGSRKALEAPEFSVSGGTYPITKFNLGLTLSNPNPAGVSRVFYSVDDGPWIRLRSNAGIRVQPETKVAAYCKSIDQRWADSERAASRYGATPVTLEAPSVRTSSTRFDFDNNCVVRVTLKDTNAARRSKLEYCVNGSDWRPYQGSIELEGKGFIKEDARVQVRAKAIANFFYDSAVAEVRIARPGSSQADPAAERELESRSGGDEQKRSDVPAPVEGDAFAAAALGATL